MVYYSDGRKEARLDRASLRELANLISDAFIEHDNWKRVIADTARRKRGLYALFYFISSVINRYGHIVVSVYEGRVVAYTTFMENSDHAQVNFCRVLRCGALPWALSFILTLRPRELAAMQEFNTSIEAYYARQHIDPGGLHLYTTAIAPSLKGRGIMKSSFAYAEECFRAAKFSSYMLETTDPTNIPVYEHFGLELTGQETMARTDRSVWFFKKALV